MVTIDLNRTAEHGIDLNERVAAAAGTTYWQQYYELVNVLTSFLSDGKWIAKLLTQ